MRTYATILPGLRSIFCVGACLLWTVSVYAADPTLARLGFSVPPERIEEFQVAYEVQVAPILKRHGLITSSAQARTTVESWFSHLFVFESPTAFSEARRALLSDASFKEVRQSLGTTFGTVEEVVTYPFGSGSLINMGFEIYKSSAGPGEQVVAGPGRGHWRTYGVIEGLVHNKVRTIVQDREGMLWFGTDGGLSRFDGLTFTTFTRQDGLPYGQIFSSYLDREGNLWFGTLGGTTQTYSRDGLVPAVGRFDGKTFVTFDRQDERPYNSVFSIVQDQKGDLWFGTADGLSRYDGETFTAFTTEDGLAHNRVWSSLLDREGTLWFGTEDGVSRYEGKGPAPFTTLRGIAGDHVRSIFQDRDGVLWFGSDSGVSRYDGKRSTIFTTQDGLVSDRVRSISQDGEGVLWFGTIDGVSRYDGKHFTTFTTQDVPAHESTLSILPDREGSLWFGTSGDVSRYDRQTFATFTTLDGLADDRVRSILLDKEGHLWFGTNGGVSRYDGQTFTNFTTQDGLTDHSVRSIYQDREGSIWFGTYGGGVSRYDGQIFVTFTTQDGLAHNRVVGITQDGDGHLWFATENGVSRYDGESLRTFTRKDGLVWDYVMSIFQEEGGSLWIGTGGGLNRFDGETFTIFNDPRFVFSMFQGPENLWFGTMGGVLRYDGQTSTRFTTKDGLAYDNVRSVFQDRGGTSWFGTYGGGVSRYDGETFTTITTEDGLAQNSVGSIVQDREGSLWFGTDGGGVTRYRMPEPVPPPVFIDAVLAGGRHEDVSDIAIPSTVALVIFEFHGISLKTRPGAMIYRYRLRGHDTSWRTTHKLRVEYQDIPVGDYVFEVQAVDRDLTYSEQPATVKLNIFYQPISATVRISDIRVQDVFASFYKTYSEHSIGSVVVINDAPDPVEAQISFHIPEFMQRPTTKKLSLKGQSRQHVDLNAIIDDVIMVQNGTQSVQAEITLASEVEDQRISVTEPREIRVYGRGALTWEPLGRAAAFVTPEDKSVAGFSRGLYEAYRQQMKGRRVDGNIPAAMLMFEALNGHGIRYTQDASTPYSQARSDQSAVDHIQYPSELLRSRRGDCDDCTVLYCSLLENLNIPTAFVDAPDHILMMFDSGVSAQREFGFSLDPSLYVERAGRFWIPVEVTKLGEGSFLEAWELGAKTCAVLATEGELKITDVRDVWADYPYAIPTIEGELDYPNADQFDQGFQASFNGLQEMRERYVEENYIEPLMMNPDDHFRQMNYAKTRIEAEDYNDAIGLLMPLLKTDYGAEAYYMIGFVNAGKKNYKSAIRFMEKALELEPGNEDYSRSVEFLRTLTEKQNKN